MRGFDKPGVSDVKRPTKFKHRVVFAGWRDWFKIFSTVSLVGMALLAVVILPAIFLAPKVAQVVGEDAVLRALPFLLGVIALLGVVSFGGLIAALFFHFFPPVAWEFFRPGVEKELRKAALHYARNWQAIAPRCFPEKVKDGNQFFPGLRKIQPVENSLKLRVRLPNSYAGQEYLDKAVFGLAKRSGIPLAEVTAVTWESGADPVINLVLKDYSLESRAVAL